MPRRHRCSWGGSGGFWRHPQSAITPNRHNDPMSPATISPSDEIGQFLSAQAARLNAEAEASPACTAYSRRVHGSRWVTNPDGTMTHWRVTHEASNEEEEWCQRHDPLRGLSAAGIKAYERLYGPQDPLKRFLARMNCLLGRALRTIFNS